MCRRALATSPLSQHNLLVWASYARCEWLYGGLSSRLDASKVFLKAIALADRLPTQQRRQCHALHWSFADVLCFSSTSPFAHDRDASSGAARSVAKFVLAAGANATIAPPHILKLKKLCKKLDKIRRQKDPTARIEEPTSATLLLQARHHYSAQLQSDLAAEAALRQSLPQFSSESIGTLPSLLYVAVAWAWLEYLVGGVHAGCKIIQRTLDMLDTLPLAHDSRIRDSGRLQEEWLRLMLLRLCRQHSRFEPGAGTPVSLVRSFSIASLKRFPFSCRFLRSFALYHRPRRFQLEVGRLLGVMTTSEACVGDAALQQSTVEKAQTPALLDDPVPPDMRGVFATLLVFAIYASSPGRVHHTHHQSSTTGGGDEDFDSVMDAAAKSLHLRRVQGFIESQCMRFADGRRFPLTWRLCLSTEVQLYFHAFREAIELGTVRGQTLAKRAVRAKRAASTSKKAARSILLRALQNCPGSKNLWLDAIRQLCTCQPGGNVLPAAEAQQWVEVAWRKGIRFHFLPQTQLDSEN